MSEFTEQKKYIAWFKETYPQYEKSIQLSMNGVNLGGGVKAARIINQMKSQGMNKGEADLFIAVPTKKYHGMALEMKDFGCVLTEIQLENLIYMNSIGYLGAWAEGAEAAIELTKEYMEGI